MSLLYYLTTFCIIINFSIAKEVVPVLIWNNNQHEDSIPPVPALQTIHFKQFKSEYLTQFGDGELPKNIILFLQDSLSVEDLSSHPEEFKFISSEMKKGHSLFLPKVEIPGFLHTDLHTHGYNVINLEPGDSIAGITLKEGSKNCIVVKLPSTATNPHRTRALLKSSEVVESVLSKIGDLSDFTIVFTGLEASVRTTLLPEFERYRRQALISDESVENITNLHNSSCTLVYFRNKFSLTVETFNESQRINLTDIPSVDFGDCQNATSSIELRYVDYGGYNKFKVGLFFHKINNRHWSTIYGKVTIWNDTDVGKEYYLHPSKPMMWIPLGKSYSCSTLMSLRTNATDSSDVRFQLDIDGVQMESFMENITRFGEAWDCVPFFTIPIWSGLIITLIMVIILGWGMHMLAEVKTMDRFDDSKSKFSLVPANLD